jgi:hypothetical protein
VCRSQALREKTNEEKSGEKPAVPAGYTVILPTTVTAGSESTIKEGPDEEATDQSLQPRDVGVV